MNFKLWYSFSLIFISYSLHQLWFETYRVNYQVIEEEELEQDNRFNLSICVKVYQIRWAFKKFENREIDDVIEVSKFINITFQMFNRTFYQFSKNSNLPMPLRLSDSYLYRNHICFIANQKYYGSLIVYRDIGFNMKLSINSQSFKYKYPHFIYLIRKRSPFNYIKISKLVTQSLGLPFSDCEQSWFDNKKSNTSNSISEYTIDSKFNCINNCLKKFNRSRFYLYSFEEDNDYIDLSANLSTKNEKLYCFEQCKKENCLFELYMAAPNNRYKIVSMYMKAYPVLTKLDYWLQFIGLIALFINISVNETVTYLLDLYLNYSSQQFKERRINSNNIIYYTKIILISINLITTILLSSIMLIEYLNCLKYPLTDSITNFDNPISPFSLTLCTPIDFLLDYDYRNLTFKEIVNETNSGYDKIVKRIYSTYGSYEKSIKVNKSNKIYFRKCNYKFIKPNNQLSRCFRIEIEKEELHFESLLTISTLIVETKLENLNYLVAFLNAANEEFNLNSYLFHREYKLLVIESKFIETSIAANCLKYSSLKLRCKSKSSCRSMCIMNKYLEKYNKLPIINTVIDKDLLNRSVSNVTFSNHFDPDIDKNCSEIFLKNDCNYIIYFSSFKSQITYIDKLEINLSFEKIFIKDHECKIGFLALRIINIFSIFFGLNVIKLSQNLFKLLIKIRLLKSNFNRLYKKIIFLISLIGFLIHIFIIFTDIIQSDYVYNGYYKKNDISDLPDLCFCFQHPNLTSIDPHQKLTGKYLDKLTNDINFETIFKLIHYIDSDKNFVYVKPNEFFLNKTGQFELWKFFYRDMKCLVISPTLPYKEEDFYFEENLYPLKIYLTDRAKQG